MKIKRPRFLVDGQVYRVPETLRADELRLLEQRVGSGENIVDVCIWLTLRRERPRLRIEQLNRLEVRVLDRLVA